MLRDTRETSSPFPRADIHRILLLLMLGFYGVVVLSWRTTKIYVARCGVCIKVGPSPSMPSSVPHEIVLNVVTSAWLHTVPELSLSTLISSPAPPGPSKAPSMVPRAHFGCIPVNTLRKSVWHGQHQLNGRSAQQHVPLECLGIYQLVSTTRQFLLTDSIRQLGLWLRRTPTPQEIARRSSLHAEQAYRTRHQPRQPPRCNGRGRGVHSVRRSGVEQRSRLSQHFPYYKVTWNKRHEHCRQCTQYERRHTGMDCVRLRRWRSRLGAAFCILKHIFEFN